MVLTLAIAAGLVGALLLVIGVRGRRVDEHPLCRRCGFDLLGTYPAKPVCPECGAELGGGRAVRTGHRRRRAAPLAAGVVFLLVAVAAGGALGWGRATSFNWNTIKPAWLLVREASGGDPADAAKNGVLSELISRVREGELSPERIAALAEVGLAHQADRETPWLTAWGSFIEAARARGQIPPELWERYAFNAARAALAVSSRAVQGESFPVEIQLTDARVPWASGISARFDVEAVEFAGAPVPAQGLSMAAQLSPGITASNRPEIRADVAPGVHRVRVAGRMTVGEAGVTITERPFELFADVEVMPAGTELQRAVSDPALADEVLAALGVSDLKLVHKPSGELVLTGRLTAKGPPIAFAFGVSVRQGEREWPLAMFTAPRAASNHQFSRQIDAAIPGLRAGVVEVVFTPSGEAARHLVDVEEYWGEPVVLSDVPVAGEERASEGPAAASPGSE